MNRGDEFVFPADATASGIRLDVFLAARLPNRSRAFASQLISTQPVKVNGRPGKPGYRLKPGDVVSGCIPPPRPSGFLPEPIPLQILYEDEHMVVINKQPGLVVHPAPGHYSGTLVNGLLYHCPDLGAIGDQLRPGIVHRLDKDTSGTLVAAKNAAALEHLAGQFKHRSVSKDYLALVHGDMPAESGTIRLPIGRHPVDRKRMSTHSRKSREAETGWCVARRLGGFTLLEMHLKTGRTHQIRVHCAAIQRPIVGDPVYGRRKAAGDSGRVHALITRVRRQMLHAWRLEIVHPFTRERMRFESPLPEDMEELIVQLEARSSRLEGKE
ncbi:MAG: RluA family pseudouridine synthase [Hyphomicrobiales bacterium]